jgi:hypothetical protein
LSEQFAGVGENDLGGLGELKAAAYLFIERDPELALQNLELLVNGGWAEVELGSCERDTAKLREGNEAAEFLDLHVGRVTPFHREGAEDGNWSYYVFP